MPVVLLDEPDSDWAGPWLATCELCPWKGNPAEKQEEAEGQHAEHTHVHAVVVEISSGDGATVVDEEA